MNALYRAALVTALVSVSLPTVGAAQKVSSDSLLHRIDSLERRIGDLEGRVGQLEGLLKAEPARGRPAVAPGNSRDVGNWRRLKRGMTMDQVRALLGEPESVAAGTYLTLWQYPGGANVTFDPDKVDGWSEPRR